MQNSLQRARARVQVRPPPDPHANRLISRLLPGEVKTAEGAGGVLTTVLGSCVAACVRNPVMGSGGMNHFMLPRSENGDWNGSGSNCRFGNFAMDILIAEVLKTGCRKEELEIKLFGGANLYRGSVMVGSMNVDFVLDYMMRNGLKPTAQDLGGSWARKIVYTPATGIAMRQVLRPHAHDESLRLEHECLKAFNRPRSPAAGL